MHTRTAVKRGTTLALMWIVGGGRLNITFVSTISLVAL